MGMVDTVELSWTSEMPTRRDVLIAGLALSTTPAMAQPASGRRTFTILHTNDRHGRHLPFDVSGGNATAQTGDHGREHQEFSRSGRIGGFGQLATALARRRAALGRDNVLLVDGGDTFADDLLGNLTRGEAVIRLMNAVGYHFMALGNHDFDYGVERTRELARIATFPMRGANIIERGSGRPFIGEATLLKQVGGVTVGLLALGYHNTHLTGSLDNVDGLEFVSGIDVARRLVSGMRGKAEAIVVVSHQGSKVDRKLLEEVEGIDLVIGAHSHDLITPPERVGGGWLVQAMSDGAMLGEVTLAVQDGKVAQVKGAMHELWSDTFAPDPAIGKLIARLRAPHGRQLGDVIANAGERIGRQYRSESPFDKLVCRILREATGAEIAFMPGVGYGVSVNPGPISREALTTLLPHPSKIATLTLSGTQLHDVLEQAAVNLAPPAPLDGVGGLIQSDGIAWSADLRRSAGQRVRDISVLNSPLDPSRRYRVAVNAGFLEGLHKFTTFANGNDVVRRDQRIADVVTDAFRKAGTVRVPALGDVKVERETKG